MLGIQKLLALSSSQCSREERAKQINSFFYYDHTRQAFSHIREAPVQPFLISFFFFFFFPCKIKWELCLGNYHVDPGGRREKIFMAVIYYSLFFAEIIQPQTIISFTWGFASFLLSVILCISYHQVTWTWKHPTSTKRSFPHMETGTEVEGRPCC